MRTKLLIVMLGLLISGSAALGQPADRQGPMRMGRHPMLFSALKLSDQQKTGVHKVWFDLRQKQIDVRASLQHARLDYEALASADNPDQKAISAKIQDMANLRAQLQQNKLDAWFAVNKLLTPEQQKTWKKVLGHPMMFQRGARLHRMADRGAMMMERMRMNNGMRPGGPMLMERYRTGGAWQGGAGPMMRQTHPSQDSSNSGN